MKLKSSYQDESVSGDNNTGGLVGFITSQINYTSVIGDNDSNVIDNITGTSNVGGLDSTQDNTTIC